jgi:N utilization substance protein A
VGIKGGIKKMKSNENRELIMAIDELEKEKGISKEYLLESLETALVSAYKKNFDSAENVKVEIDNQTGEIHVYAQKEVVEVVENSQLQISLENARQIEKKTAIGDIINIETKPKDFGRIAAGAAKQHILQKVREAERNMIFNEYNERKGEIVTGIVQKADKGTVILDLGKLEGIMPLKEQIPTEHYKVNDKVKAYVLSVEKGLKGAPQVLVTRSHPDVIKKLFELEIPEIYEGLIEVKAVSRDPGNRSKVAVYSKNPDIDPVGSCVGSKGIRIQNIINEMNGEKIDVIEWSEDPATFICAALLPAHVMAIDIKESERFAQVIVPDEELSLAIGKGGQNARLAVKLTNWKIDIKSETQYRELMAYEENKEEKQEEGNDE